MAAFATTQEFPVNDSGTSKKITGAQLIAALPQGTLTNGYAQVVANQVGILAATDLTGLTVTVTPGSGRRIKITGSCRLQQNTALGNVTLTIQEGATVLNTMISASSTGGGPLGFNLSVILTPTAAAHTYKLTLQTTNNTVDLLASTTSPAFILAEDIGV